MKLNEKHNYIKYYKIQKAKGNNFYIILKKIIMNHICALENIN